MEAVHVVEHLLGVGIARRLELMRAPLVLGPVVPVLYDVVDGDVALAELREGAHQLILGLVALTALPEAQHPLGIERGLAGEGAIARDDLVEVVALDEIVVHVLRHLAPNGELLALLLAAGLSDTQTTVGLAPIGTPLDAQLDTTVGLEIDGELIGVGVPGGAPALGHHLTAIDIDLDVA